MLWPILGIVITGLAGGGLALWLKWQLERSERQDDADRRRYEAAEQAYQELRKADEDRIRSLEASTNVLRSLLARAQSDMAGLATAHPDLAREYFGRVLQAAAAPVSDRGSEPVSGGPAPAPAGTEGGDSGNMS